MDHRLRDKGDETSGEFEGLLVSLFGCTCTTFPLHMTYIFTPENPCHNYHT